MSACRSARWVPLLRLIGACGAGALAVPAFAPYGLYPLALLSPALLLLLLGRGGSPGEGARLGWCYGVGLLGFGVFWMHISIDRFGNVGSALAILLTLLFIFTMALYYALLGWGVRRLSGAGAGGGPLLLFAGLWVLGEWLRGWLLGGFPWLVLGYSQIDSALAGWAPLFGVYGVSLVLVLGAGLLVMGLRGGPGRIPALLFLAALWGGGAALQTLEWTRPGEALRVSLVQGNIAQELKWKRAQLAPTLRLYSELTEPHWESDIVIWPETAVPAFAHQVEEAFLAPLSERARETDTALLLGVPVWEDAGRRYYNAMLSLGAVRDHYYKRHLVPFGEFMPLRSLLGPLLEWMQVPMSDFAAGEGGAPLIRLGRFRAGVSICYEDAFGEEMLAALPLADFLVNASNDAWFGDSLAPHQHLQIARQRALETGRYLLRATNTGISAIIDPQGRLLGTSPAFRRHVLQGSIRVMHGTTPYVRWGNAVAVLLAAALALLGWRVCRRRDSTAAERCANRSECVY
ncbi:MAG: apolipoprotein N-acyltransferase [Candidatus Sedimenticola endophacoides]|uniref:Apolipoprotein N-acyltransferase n=1 Tax=Candidatus Sedimenticola endophacoides TaxID=2548426 RepID=A0A6N4DGI6_9GAMM|nr:MAG: apolipoprotein N-acyltransferase [Candidatus Sedimenticola endophacoides]OQX38254.1 MAG: apolipoprotein N-acyltransferase [Candidatus Sedimenticola endophacoides]OQX38618.1 MAG: apolipoprotein N-acyltransferase [Candidatus Sedimenticola endophacoides]PUD97993.1 MAG: apolipoprotein N-acyltransferase [Candidatus Sedimenticola endophacoides]PUE00682.1 MAG: apolipoprotein N-acyltransferase [Candidatus Sedimenticola endophacoides]